MREVMTKSMARNIFYGGSLFFIIIFAGLAFNSHRYILTTSTDAATLTDSVIAGKRIWEAKTCINCHTILGEGAYFAPELGNVMTRWGVADDPQAATTFALLGLAQLAWGAAALTARRRSVALAGLALQGAAVVGWLLAKITGMKLCAAYHQQYGCNFISAMPTNLYGPNDNFDLTSSHVLPALIRKFHDAKVSGADEVEIWGTGSPMREFLHVDDLADALEALHRT